EAETLTWTGSAGIAITTNPDTAASGGNWVLLASTATTQFINFTTTSIPAGTYQMQIAYKANTTRAQHSVKLDGGASIGTVDQYSATVGYPGPVNVGSPVTFGTAGTHTITLTVTGKNAA